MSNILFIEKRLRADKIGFCVLATEMKKAGHIVDMVQDDVDPAESYLDSHHVDYIMFSVMSGEQDWMMKKNDELRQMFPHLKTIVGGPHFTYFPEEGEKNHNIEFVVRGPGETVINDILAHKIDTKMVKAPLPHLCDTPIPDRTMLYKYDEFGKAKMKRFMANRYCPHICSYCFNHQYKDIYKEQLPYFKELYPVDKILEELKDVRDKYGLELAYFNDDNLAFNHEWLSAFAKGIKQLGLKFCGSVRADNVSEDILQEIAQSGCTFLNMALESGVDETRKLLRRTGATYEKVRDTAKLAMKHGIKIRIQNMIGLPVDDPLEDALTTLKCNQEIDPTDSWVSLYQPYGGTDLWKYCLEKGLIEKDFVAHGQYDASQFKCKDNDRLYRLSRWWFFLIKHKIPEAFVRILIELPLTKEQDNYLMNLRLETSKNLLYIL